MGQLGPFQWFCDMDHLENQPISTMLSFPCSLNIIVHIPEKTSSPTTSLGILFHFWTTRDLAFSSPKSTQAHRHTPFTYPFQPRLTSETQWLAGGEMFTLNLFEKTNKEPSQTAMRCHSRICFKSPEKIKSTYFPKGS